MQWSCGLVLLPSSSVDVYIACFIDYILPGLHLLRVLYSYYYRASWYKPGWCYVSSVLCPYYRVEWLLIRDPSFHGWLSSWDIQKRRKSCVHLHQNHLTVSKAVLRGLQFEIQFYWGLRFEIQSFWGQPMESLDPVAFFHFVKSGILPMYLLY